MCFRGSLTCSRNNLQWVLAWSPQKYLKSKESVTLGDVYKILMIYIARKHWRTKSWAVRNQPMWLPWALWKERVGVIVNSMSWGLWFAPKHKSIRFLQITSYRVKSVRVTAVYKGHQWVQLTGKKWKILQQKCSTPDQYCKKRMLQNSVTSFTNRISKKGMLQNLESVNK